MKTIIFAVFLLLPLSIWGQQIQKGDTILIRQGKKLDAIQPYYIRKDDWLTKHELFKETKMAGKKFIVWKAKDSYILFKAPQVTNGWTPLKFSLNIDRAAEDSCVILFRKE